MHTSSYKFLTLIPSSRSWVGVEERKKNEIIIKIKKHNKKEKLLLGEGVISEIENKNEESIKV